MGSPHPADLGARIRSISSTPATLTRSAASSYVPDRYERYLAWYDKYVPGKKPAGQVRRYRRRFGYGSCSVARADPLIHLNEGRVALRREVL